MTKDPSRRNLLQFSASAVTLGACETFTDRLYRDDFTSNWGEVPDRPWVGAHYWANPLQDWALIEGRLQNVFARPNANVHVLTRQLGDGREKFETSVKVGAVSERMRGSVGFLIGVKGAVKDYRSALIDHQSGIVAGISADGFLFLSDERSSIDWPPSGIELVLTGVASGDQYELTLTVYGLGDREILGRVSTKNILPHDVTGNIALAVNHLDRSTIIDDPFAVASSENESCGQYWFSDWRILGPKVKTRQNQTFGPILFSQYTLSQSTIKITAQTPPLGHSNTNPVRLEVRRSNDWTEVGSALIENESNTATIKVDQWDATVRTDYRLVLALADRAGRLTSHYWYGTFQADPVQKDRLSVADISCNTHEAFPNAVYVDNTRQLNPDLIAFVGDQFYEGSGGYGIEPRPLDRAMLDLQRRWYLHGWTWRELTKDRPSVCIPDDHDVLQGNIWGDNGRIGSQKPGAFDNDDESGYEMPARWVNMVHRLQTSHHPEPAASELTIGGLRNYYGALVYGGVSFAILADRMFKSGPKEFAPPTGNERADHVTDFDFDSQSADTTGATLLGEGQLLFLKRWAEDWQGIEMKAVLSQTVFTSMATHHGPEKMILRADYDSNAWPQTPRNAALKEIRKALAFHIAGDQHLPALVQYGIDQHRDAGFAFAGPAVNVGYPRFFEPRSLGQKPISRELPYTGDFADSFDLPMTVIAYANGTDNPRLGNVLQTMQDRAAGLGVVHFNKSEQTVTVECWPYLANPLKQEEQFPGWPVTTRMIDSYTPREPGYLPTFNFSGTEHPIIKIIDEASQEIVYSLRVRGCIFQPVVENNRQYTIIIRTLGSGNERSFDGLLSSSDNQAKITVAL